jgi:hypothetical protein
MNKLIKIAMATSLIAGSIATSQACTLGAWDDNGTSTAIAGGPGEPAGPTNFARYSGLCAMQTAGATPSVKNNGAGGATSGPSGEATMNARFYFKADGATGTIFETYEEDVPATAVYTVAFDGTNVTVTPNAGGSATSTAVGSTNWHSVEVSWANNGGAINVWVDSDATTDPADASTTSEASGDTINTAILGGVTGMTFDAYESRRTTPIGRLVAGDANNDTNVNIFDAIGVVNESSGGGLINVGQPDCNEDGNINIFDAICVVNIASGN